MPDDALRTNVDAGVPSMVHPFAPRGAWWTTCRVCGLAEAAHVQTTLTEDDRK